jgi:ADP-ribose pyrophosphatase YjhB (NUDIX family)
MRLRRERIDGRTRRTCPRCGWIFYGNPVPAVVALVARGNRVLLARRAHPPYAGTWDLPGGFLEADESPDDGLRRELREELGLGVRGMRLLALMTDRYGPGGFPVLTAVYRVAPEPGPLHAADDVSEARWFPRTALPLRDVAFPSMRQVLRDWANPR